MSTPLPSDDFANEILTQYENFVHFLLTQANAREWTRLALGANTKAMLEGDARDIKGARYRGERYRTLAAARRIHKELEFSLTLLIRDIDKYRSELEAVIAKIEKITDAEDYYSRLDKGTFHLLNQVKACVSSINWQSLVIPVRATAAQQAMLAMNLCLKEGFLAGDNVWYAQLVATWRAYETFYYFDCHRLMKIDGPHFVRLAQPVLSAIEKVKAELEAERAAEEERSREDDEVAQQTSSGYGHQSNNTDSHRHSDDDDDYYNNNSGPRVNYANGLPMMGNSGVDIHGNPYGTNWNDFP